MSTAVQRDARPKWRPSGLESLLVPSFTADLRELDEAGIRLDVRQGMAHGVTALAVVLEAGLTLDEQLRFLRVAGDEAAGRIGLAPLLPATAPERVLELVGAAADAGATHAYLGCAPSFAPADDAEVIRHVEQLAARAPLPLCLLGDRFVFPCLHPSGLPLDALERIAELENVVALQLGSLDAGLLEETCERFGERLAIGSPHPALQPLLVRHFGVRWTGPWAVEGLQSPQHPHAVRFFDGLLAGRMEEAMQTYWKLAPALGAIARVAGSFAHTGANHWPLVKYQQWLSGGNGGLTRQPVMRVFQRDLQVLRAGLAAVDVECGDADEAFFLGRGGRRPA